jgi:predicted phage terminase large subunit-like protein
VTDVYASLAESLRGSAASDWSRLARPNQLPPPGDWRIWLVLAGRGFGKTRTGAEWVRAQAETRAAKRIALVSATASDCRDVLIEGESGILAISPRWNRPTYEPTKRRLTWPNGAIATAYSADEAERLRGPQHDAAWCDELAAWRYPESWDMLMMGLRLGTNPRCVVTTIPKPTKLLRDLVGREGKDVVITRGATRENAENLAPQFLESIVSRYAGTRLGRQELDGELLTDTPGALWSASVLESMRVATAPPLQRIVVAVDPSGSGGEKADDAGIIVAGLGQDGQGYTLSDLSDRLAPTEWARRAIDAYRAHRADRLVAEVNYGGQMVTATIAAVDPSVPVKTITSSRGKVLRAEPIAAFFEQGRAHLVGSFPELEDQMTSFTSDYSRSRDGSPGRVDALVFALTELMLGQPLGGFFRESLFLTNGEPIELPQRVDYVFAIAVATQNGDSVGFVYCAAGGILGRTPDVTMAPSLTVLDYDLHEFAGLQTWLPEVFRKLTALAPACTVRADTFFSGNAGLMVEGSGVGGAVLEHALSLRAPVNDLDGLLALPPTFEERVLLASNTIHAGKVRLARQAHERLVTHQSVTRNHLVAQLLSYRNGAEEPGPTELLDALCIALALIEPEGRNEKRRGRT